MPVTLDAIAALPRQTAAWLTANNPSLPAGARYLETDTGRTKTNSNLTAAANWNSLAYDLVGEKGDPGPTPYQRQVQLGFTGTEQEWFDSLKGDTGDDGTSFTVVVGSTIPTTQDANTLYVRV